MPRVPRTAGGVLTLEIGAGALCVEILARMAKLAVATLVELAH